MRTYFFLIIFILLSIFSADAKDDKLVVAVGKDNYVTSGPRANLGKYPLNANIFESLTTFDQRFHLHPCLAISWEYKGNNTWKFNLRKGVRFHDKSTFDAASVRISLEKQAESGTLLFDFTDIKEISEYSIEITTPKENLILPYILSHPYIGIAKHEVGSGLRPEPIGTGPFRFDRYEKDQYLEIQRNNDYWGEKAKTTGIIFRFIPDNSSRVMAFLAKEADILADIPWEVIMELCKESLHSCQLYTSPVGTYVGLMLSKEGILADKHIRQAIAMGLDRLSIINALWHGLGETRQTLLAPEFIGEYATLIQDVPYSPDKAVTLLNGKHISLTLVSGFPNAAIHGSLPEIIQSQLKDVGIDIHIKKVNDMGLYHSMMKQHKGDMWLEKGNPNSADLTFLPHLLFHPEGYYPKQLKTISGTEMFCNFIDNARKSQNIEEFRKYTALSLKEIIYKEFLFIPIAELPFMLAAHTDINVPDLYPTFLTTHWDYFFRKR